MPTGTCPPWCVPPSPHHRQPPPVSNDSDLTEPIRIVRQELGKVVGLLNPQPQPSHMLMRCKPGFAKQIRAGVLRTSQFPPDFD